MMQLGNTTEDRTQNESSKELVTIYTALGIGHLIIVVVPSLVLAFIVLYHLLKLMKTSGVKPVTLLFFFNAFLCLLGPLSYGIIWDISLITDIPIFGNCSSPKPVHNIQYLLYFGLTMAVSLTITMIAVLQFMVLQCRRGIIKLKYVIAAYAALLIFSFSVNCIFFNTKVREIRGSHCKGTSGTLNTVVWMCFSCVIPFTLTVLFSILTCLKVKKNVSNDQNTVVKSVILLNTFNIVTFIVVRAGALLLFFTVVSINSTTNTVNLWTLMARYIGELNYPLGLFSIMIVHSNIRRMVFNCCKISTHRTRDIPLSNTSSISAP